MAERGGFEPPRQHTPTYRISNPAPSASWVPLRVYCLVNIGKVKLNDKLEFSRLFCILTLMKKIPLLLAIFALVGCSSTAVDEGLSVNLEEVLVVEDKVNFDFSLNRDDLGLKAPEWNEEDVVYVEDLPDSMHPVMMILDGENAQCDYSFIPFRCESDEIKDTFDLDVVFADESTLKTTVLIPLPETMSEPEVVKPLEKPKNGDMLSLEFKDAGYDKYTVIVRLCERYKNNGINPCLEGVDYMIERVDGELVIADKHYSPEISVHDGMVSLKAEYPLHYELGVEYTVIGTISGESDAIETYVKKSSNLIFE